jgi:ferritin
MLTKEMLEALNGQINAELFSSYLYLSASAWFEAENLPGSAAWMRKQAREENAHAMKLFDYICDRDGRVSLAAIAAPTASFSSAEDVWTQAHAHEQKITADIDRLYAMAEKAKDFATVALLQWFVTEQVEEEKTARSILEQVKMIKSTTSMFFLDRHLGKDAAK